MNFTKVAVPALPPPAASGLAASLSAPASRVRSATPTSFDVAPVASTRSEGYSVAQVVNAVVEAYQQHLASSGAPGLTLRVEDLVLLVAEDDGTTADPDFPEIDPSVAITSVGVDKFVLAAKGGGAADADAAGGAAASGSPRASGFVLRVTIPTSAIALRACEAGAAADKTLLVTCYPPASSAMGCAQSFTAQLSDGGAARPLLGVAAPSAQALGALTPE